MRAAEILKAPTQSRRETLRSFARLVKALGGIGDCRIVWKSRHGSPQALPKNFRYLAIHTDPFCTAVKRDRGRLAHCIADDVDLVMRRCDGRKESFIKTCHAGVSELVVPLWRSEVFDGALFCGIWKAQSGVCPYPGCRHAFANVALTRQPHLGHLRVLLEQLGAWAVEQVGGSGVPVARDRRVAAVLERLHGRELHAYSMAELAAGVFLSPSRLQHLFAAQVGMPLNRYLTQLRIEHARLLIVSTRQPLHAVAREAGYENYTYFSTLIRRVSGMSPRALRAKGSRAIQP